MVCLVVGDVNADIRASLAGFPHEGDDVAVSHLTWSSGGSAANVATALARLGGRARLCARLGRDPAAAFALREARTAGVDVVFVQEDETLATGLCYAAISPGGERTFFSSRGANVAMQLPDLHAVFQDVDLVHIAAHALLSGQQYETTCRLMDEASSRGIPISIDVCLPLMRQFPARLPPLLPRFAVLFANELELETIALLLGFQGNEPDPALAGLSALLAAGSQLVIGKLGANGSVVARGNHRAHIPAFPVKARDTTGAGDAFVAAFLFAQGQGASPEKAALFANAAGSIVAERASATGLMPTQDEVRYKYDTAENTGGIKR